MKYIKLLSSQVLLDLARGIQYYFGCSGWSYKSWQGPFYPKDIENFKWLKYYSKIFDYVE
jgi:hypothetical protein